MIRNWIDLFICRVYFSFFCFFLSGDIGCRYLRFVIFIMRKFDHKFTRQLGSWLNDDNRDYAEGAMLLFRLRGNQIEFRKLSADPNAYKKYIFNNIKKFYDFRSAEVPHEVVDAKVRKAETVATTAEADSEGVRSGKRSDHDSLPEDIRMLYDENRNLIRKIADLHTKLRLIIASNANCKDADLLPFAEEIVRLDKIRLANWKTYDNFKLPAS